MLRYLTVFSLLLISGSAFAQGAPQQAPMMPMGANSRSEADQMRAQALIYAGSLYEAKIHELDQEVMFFRKRVNELNEYGKACGDHLGCWEPAGK